MMLLAVFVLAYIGWELTGYALRQRDDPYRAITPGEYCLFTVQALWGTALAYALVCDLAA